MVSTTGGIDPVTKGRQYLRVTVLHLPSRWPWALAWRHLRDHTIGNSPPTAD